MIDFAWLADHVGAIFDRTIQHIWLTAIALFFGFVLSFGLAIVAVRRRRTWPPINALSEVIYTIPSLAVFAALVPITGFSLFTAVFPLIMYTLVILVRNMVAGFDLVPGDVIEAASGMGYTPNQRLWGVEVPLAMPLIMAGVRIACVSTIGLVTISGIIGDKYGGLGFFIFEGYHRNFPTEIYAGAIPSIVLAIAADLALLALLGRITPWSRLGRADAGPGGLAIPVNETGAGGIAVPVDGADGRPAE